MEPALRLEVLTEYEPMLARYPLLKQLNPTLTLERYAALLQLILKQGGYFQLACFQGDACVGLTGVWISTKVWCGKFIEVDNFVVDENHRGKGIGKLLLEWVEKKGRSEGCESMHLDSYIVNEKANRFYFANGFTAKGYHMKKEFEGK